MHDGREDPYTPLYNPYKISPNMRLSLGHVGIGRIGGIGGTEGGIRY